LLLANVGESPARKPNREVFTGVLGIEREELEIATARVGLLRTVGQPS
jgi:hypothetical protein